MSPQESISLEDLCVALPVPAFLKQDQEIAPLNCLAFQLQEWANVQDLDLRGLEQRCRVTRLESGAKLLLMFPEDKDRRFREQQAGIGGMAAGFVHNLNNPLNAMAGLLQLMEMKLGEHRDMGKMERQQDKLVDIIRKHGERYRKLHSPSEGRALAWTYIFERELEFLKADARFKHQCKFEIQIPEHMVSPLNYVDASWLIDRLLESILSLIPKTGSLDLDISLHEDWPQVKIFGKWSQQDREALLENFLDGQCQQLLKEQQVNLTCTRSDEFLQLTIRRSCNGAESTR